MNVTRFNIYAVDVQGQGLHFVHWAFDSNKSQWCLFGSLSTIHLQPTKDNLMPISGHAERNACIQVKAKLNSPSCLPSMTRSFFLYWRHWWQETFLVESVDYCNCLECKMATIREKHNHNVYCIRLYRHLPLCPDYIFKNITSYTIKFHVWPALLNTKSVASHHHAENEKRTIPVVILFCHVHQSREVSVSKHNSHVPNDAQTWQTQCVCVSKCCANTSRGKTPCICFTSAITNEQPAPAPRPRIVSPTSLSASLLCIY